MVIWGCPRFGGINTAALNRMKRTICLTVKHIFVIQDKYYIDKYCDLLLLRQGKE